MYETLLAVWFMWISLVMKELLGNTCNPGWFGTGCMFQCHCSGITVCEANGNCPGVVPCARPYFGPACQYVDLISWNSSVPASLSYLSDNDDNTCNPDQQALLITITLPTAYRLTWFRLQVNDYSKLLRFVVLLDDSTVECRPERKFQVSPLVVDMTCNITAFVRKLEIVGEVVPYICAMYISGGRNVALKQRTTQSTNHTRDGTLAVSPNAVDGNTDGEYNHGSCTRTQDYAFPSHWTMTYDRQYTLSLIRIFNRSGYYSLRIIGFHLYTTDSTRENITTYTDRTGSSQSIYNITITDTRPVQMVTVRLTNDILTLCEVETYGEAVCQHNKFGLQCEKPCNCNATEVCNHVTGTCTLGCARGWFGSDCTARCDSGCAEDTCHVITGNCISCVPGLQGANCTQPCLPGTYGVNCSLRCPLHCSGVCNNTDGRCSCDTGFTGPLCQECPPGTYGLDCGMQCPLHCANVCNNRNGDCTCEAGYFGLECEECPPGTYGWNCIMDCPLHCTDTCNVTDGNCTCDTGYFGPGCEACLPGAYGLNCSHQCSRHCTDVCNNTDGRCTCSPPFTGLQCQECTNGLYGDDCDKPCSANCRNRKCLKVSGHCLLCDNGHVGSFCKECLPSYFGTLCKERCSKNCLNGTCDALSGSCQCRPGSYGKECSTECLPSYFGTLCKERCSKNCLNGTCDALSGSCQCRPGSYGKDCSTGDSPQDVLNPVIIVVGIMAASLFTILFFLCTKRRPAATPNVGEE